MLWLLLALLITLIYWELIIAEGAHLGARVVTRLYDDFAPRYDRIKKFNAAFEDACVGWPLAQRLVMREAPRVLDVAAGTGRVGRALLRQVFFDGVIINVDLSAGMLAHGQRACAPWAARLGWVQAPAAQLPFADTVFDAVTCLEALEFFPSAPAALAECARVLRPGGVLLVTQRIGWRGWFIVGKTPGGAALKKTLAKAGFTDVQNLSWQKEYRLVWAKKIDLQP